MDETDRKRMALFRLSVLGPLISCRLVHGDRRALFIEAAARVHQQPDGPCGRPAISCHLAISVVGWSS